MLEEGQSLSANNDDIDEENLNWEATALNLNIVDVIIYEEVKRRGAQKLNYLTNKIHHHNTC